MEVNMQDINRHKLFFAACLALVVTSLSFGIRAGILNELSVSFQLNGKQLGAITATSFWGFPLAVIIGGTLVDSIGMKRLLVLAFAFHLCGILLTIFAQGYWTLFASTLLIGIANGTVEAVCNPMIATLYPEDKVKRLNYFHLWFPGGIVIGTLVVVMFTFLGLNWKFQVACMFIPTLIYGYLFSKLTFPVTQRVSAGISTAHMYKSITSPLYIFIFICMLGTATTEMFTSQWIVILLKNITNNSILILTLTSGVMVIGRGIAGPVMRQFSPQSVLLISAMVATLGLYLLSTVNGHWLLFSAVIFGMGVCYFLPTLLGIISDQIPESGAFGLNLMSGAGMVAVSFYTLFMGDMYDHLILKELPVGAKLADYMQAKPGTWMSRQLENAKSLAGPEILGTTLFIPLMLIVCFAGLFYYLNLKKKNVV
ncbi:Fucose permease [bacterium A37T11]|nr:Fucose permease [bacterium A37T11]